MKTTTGRTTRVISVLGAMFVMAAAAAPAACAGALESLKLSPGAEPSLMAIPAVSAPVQVWPDMPALPDDTVKEPPTTIPEVLPKPRPGAAGVEVSGNIDPDGVIPVNLKNAAREYYQENISGIPNARYVGIIDFAKHSSVARFHIIDMKSGKVLSIRVAHGKGSDKDGDGYAETFSNEDSSYASSLGYYLTGDYYNGAHGLSMRLHGLSASNSNAFSRTIVIHKADYVRDEAVKQGRSWGCPAVSNDSIAYVLETLGGGALIYGGLGK